MEKKNLIHRLNIIQGQLDAIKKLVENDEKDCVKTIRLLKAANNALKSFGETYVSEHLNECIRMDIPKKDLEEGLKEVIHSAFSL